eukprot:scaffold2351_cov84-Skeletonema_dohrnii-CCMP3373.AAC.14
MQRKHQQRPSLQLRRWLSRRFTADFSNIDWGDDDSCESGTPQTGGDEAGRSAIESRQDNNSSNDTKKKNPLRRLWSAGGEEAGRGAIISGQDSGSSDDTKKKHLRLSAMFNSFKVNNKPTAATADEENKHGRKQPVKQHKSSSTPAALAAPAPAPAPALVHPPTSTLDESEISVDDDGFLPWHHSQRTVMISE